ncbi:hypothetical protein [Ancylobacter moscoviensis]
MKDQIEHEAFDKAERLLIAIAMSEGVKADPEKPLAAAVAILTMALAEALAMIAQHCPDPAAFVEQSIPEIAQAVRDTAAALHAATAKPEGSC